MASVVSRAVCLLFIILWTGSHAECSDQKRVRKAWHSLSHDDQMLYALGFQELKRRGVLIQFIEAHQKATGSDEYNIHSSAQNLFWHSYWLYELENAFRALGEEYDCFTLPYWDVTKDGAYWNNAEDPQIDDIPIYDGVLGGEGNIDDDYCVGGLWSRENYETDAMLCADDEEEGGCCLKRWHSEIDDLNRSTVLYTPSEIAEYVYTDSQYLAFNSFMGRIGGFHGDIHSFFGAKAGTHFCGDGNGEPTYDPLFPVFHTFIEYLRLLHQDCNQFDVVSADDLDDLVPNAFDPTYKGGNVSLDFVMDYSLLCDDSNGKKKAMCSDHDITPRKVYDMSPNSQFNIVYELGDFWTDNIELKSMCAENLNLSWWRVPAVDAMDNEIEEFVSNQGVHSESAKWLNSKMSVSAMILMVIAVSVMALLRVCSSRGKKVENLVASSEDCAYGTV